MWAAENASALNGDAGRLAIGGDSAGGNLAAGVALKARDENGPAIHAQVLYYPVTADDFTRSSYKDNAEGYFLTTKAMEWFWVQYMGDEAHRSHPYAAPLKADSVASLPPAYVVTAHYDPLRDEGEAYAKALLEAAVPVTFERYHGQIHGFVSMIDMIGDAKRVAAKTDFFLKSAFA